MTARIFRVVTQNYFFISAKSFAMPYYLANSPAPRIPKPIFWGSNSSKKRKIPRNKQSFWKKFQISWDYLRGNMVHMYYTEYHNDEDFYTYINSTSEYLESNHRKKNSGLWDQELLTNSCSHIWVKKYNRNFNNQSNLWNRYMQVVMQNRTILRNNLY